ncbi:tail fiber assembly protein [Pseudomonas paraglycinae]|jgi:hypothetical protein|uniref:tail fiber assembly protein n=1 Tax=Pseudomonas paraglycinae TaxID=2892330 RepID=UPI001F2AD663|nr:tail fiber assembly protein [Pseudomonas paraglycinae]
MNRYVFITMPNSKVYRVVDTDEGMPVSFPDGLGGLWVDATGNTEVVVGWNARLVNNQWELHAPTFEEVASQVKFIATEKLSNAKGWLTFNPLDYKQDLGIATPEEEAALLAYKQYVIAVCDYRNQPGYPYTMIWPTEPFSLV